MNYNMMEKNMNYNMLEKSMNYRMEYRKNKMMKVGYKMMLMLYGIDYGSRLKKVEKF